MWVKRGDLSDKLKHPVKWGNCPMFICWTNGAIRGTCIIISEIGLFYQHSNVGKMGSFVGRLKTSVNWANLPTFIVQVIIRVVGSACFERNRGVRVFAS